MNSILNFKTITYLVILSFLTGEAFAHVSVISENEKVIIVEVYKVSPAVLTTTTRGRFKAGSDDQVYVGTFSPARRLLEGHTIKNALDYSVRMCKSSWDTNFLRTENIKYIRTGKLEIGSTNCYLSSAKQTKCETPWTVICEYYKN